MATLAWGCGGGVPADDAAAPIPDAGQSSDAHSVIDAGAFDGGEDSAAEDASVDTDAPSDDGATDGGLDAAICDFCFPPNDCQVASGCAPVCTNANRPDGVFCSDNFGTCLAGRCVITSRTCGVGTREALPIREGCDDGNNDPGDACSPTCVPTLLTIASVAHETNRPRGQAPAMAVDGAGYILFVWVGTVSPVGTDPYAQVLARRYSNVGAPQGDVLIVEDHVGSSQPVQPRVAGQASGWVVTWRSTAVEGAGGEQGGVAYRAVTHDGMLRNVRRANTTLLGDQLDPTLVTLSTGFVIVWTDTSAELVTGDLRMRAFDPFGTPISGELPATTTTSEDQSHAVSAARGSASSLGTAWSLAFTDTSDPSGPRVRVRRFDGTTPLSAADTSDFPVAHSWSAEPTIAMSSTDVIVGWTGRATDAHGDVYVRRIADGTAPTDDASVDPPFASMAAVGMSSPTDELAAVAPFPLDGSQGYVVGWHTNSRLTGPGVRFAASSGVALPPEATDLASDFRAGSADMTLAATDVGLWVGWSDASMTGVPDAFVAYLLPWD